MNRIDNELKNLAVRIQKSPNYKLYKNAAERR